LKPRSHQHSQVG